MSSHSTDTMPSNRLFPHRADDNDDGSRDETYSSWNETSSWDETTSRDTSSDGLEIVEPSSSTNQRMSSNMYLNNYDFMGSNPCASNDIGDPNSPCTPNSAPRTQFLSCIAPTENELLFDYGAVGTVFEFDYELSTPSDNGSSHNGNNEATLREAIDEFQNGLAGSIAADFGVYCQHDTYSGRRLGKEFVVANDTDDGIGGGGIDSPVCLGVSSSPSDVVDEFISE